MEQEYAEVVQFTLTSGTEGVAYLAAAEPSRAWYRQQPGYRGSELIESSDGQWLGIIRWDSQQAAEEAAARAVDELDMSPMMTMVDVESVRMLGGEVVARDG